jgi:GST-like protein
MIKLFHAASPNVFKVTIALEELGLEYRLIPIDITKGEQFKPAFLSVSPNNRIPAIIDEDPVDNGPPIQLFESGAILIYLAERAGRLLPADLRGRARVIQWVMWQMAGQGPMLGQAGHFRNYASEKIAYGIERYTKEAARLYRVLDMQLAAQQFIAGDYSIADIACWPWILFRSHHGIELEEYPLLERWFRAVEARPAVRRGLGDFVVSAPPVFDAKTRAILFNLEND